MDIDQIVRFFEQRKRLTHALLMLASAVAIFVAGMEFGEFLAIVTGAA
ncbi:hypothetical protein [Sphingomonas sp. DT-204]